MLKIGDKAPTVLGKDQNGAEVNLEAYKGKKVVLYFYPKDNTPGCTDQACDLRDNIGAIKNAGYEIIGISIDDEKSHRKFIEKFSLPFPLIADVDKKLVEAFGVWVEKSMYGKTYMGTARVTFVIDEDGTIINVIDKVKTKEHSAQILG